MARRDAWGARGALVGVWLAGAVLYGPTGCGGDGDPVAGNLSPQAVADLVTTPIDTPVRIEPAANDVDPDRNPLFLDSYTSPAFGLLGTVVGGILEYVPSPGFVGTVTFQYTVVDGHGGSAVGTVSIVVGGVAGTPVLAVIPDGASLGCGSPPLQYSALRTNPDSSVTDVTGAVTWASSNPAVAVIDSSGLATPAGPGTCTISATLSTLTSSVQLTITGSAGTAAPLAIELGFSSPEAPLLVDLDGDTRLDLVVTDSLNDQLFVLFGTTGGGLGNPVAVALPERPFRVVSGDLDGDGDPDLAVSVSGSGSGGVVILLGNGDGTFAAPVSYPVAGDTRSLAIGRFNGDAFLDLVSSQFSGSSLHVWLGVGDGTFGAASTLAAGAQIKSLEAADIDTDGDLDLVGVDDFNLRRFLGDGSGGFAAFGAGLLVGSLATDLAIGDLDGDGDVDVATANDGSDSVSVLLGDGAGGFGAATSIPMAMRPVWIEIGQVDGAGGLDLVVANRLSGTFAILPGAGDGTFPGPARHYFGGAGNTGVTFADLDTDGVTDLVGIDSFDYRVLIHRGAGAASPPGARMYFEPGGDRPQNAAFADFNGDGDLDLATLIPAQTRVVVFLGQGDGTFVQPALSTSAPVSTYLDCLAAGDIDGNGTQDLVVSGTQALVWLPGLGDGSFGTPVTIRAVTDSGPVVVVDLDGDLDLDVVGSAHFPRQVIVGINQGGGTFSSSVAATLLNAVKSMVAGDFDGDGDADVAFANWDVGLMRGDGAGGLAAPVSLGVPFSPNSLAAGDFDQDGDLDLAALGEFWSSIDIRLNGGTGAFTAGTPVPIAGGPTNVTLQAGHMDCNGFLDLVVTMEDPAYTRIFSGAGDGTFAAVGSDIPTATLRSFLSQHLLVLGDLDGNGKLDVVTTNIFNADTVEVVLAP